MDYKHQTVLLNEAVKGLNIDPSGTYVDCTLGGGGHSKKILDSLVDGHLYSFDQDQVAIDYNQQHLADDLKNQKVTFIHDNFENIKVDLAQYGVQSVNGILYDLGVSSPQFDDSQRGFSYNYDARLDMRMDQRNPLDAWEVVNHWSFQKLVQILNRYGEEKFAKSIARKIELHREKHSIDTTFELVDVIKEAIPAAARRHGGHPAKKAFQAIRIAVNDELGALERSLESALKLLAVNGRISVITFQSLEDRLVKTMFKEVTTISDVPQGLPVIPDSLKPHFKLVNRKAIVPNEAELNDNHRSHSAKLRIIEKIK